MTDEFFLRVFTAIGFLYAVTGAAFIVFYGRELKHHIPGAFLSFGTGIIIITNRWWLFADLNADAILMALGAACLCIGWIFALFAVLLHLRQQRELLSFQSETKTDE